LESSDQAESDANGGRFAQLCRLACKWSVDPESFRAMLVRADLADSRASEIKCVLECVRACRDFIRSKNAISWRQALIEARQHRLQIPELLQAARRLIGPVVRRWELCREFSSCDLKFRLKRENNGKFVLEHEEGVLTIEPITPAPEPDNPGKGETKP
jgi:CBS-domain-containing membrane protein